MPVRSTLCKGMNALSLCNESCLLEINLFAELKVLISAITLPRPFLRISTISLEIFVTATYLCIVDAKIGNPHHQWTELALRKAVYLYSCI